MKPRGYIERISFRIIFPALSGITLYLAMLMVFGNLESLSESFFSQEALFLVILTYLNHEWAIFLLGRKRSRQVQLGPHPLPKIALTLVLLTGTIILSSAFTLVYFMLVLEYNFFLTELVTINILMVLFQLLVHLYYISMINIRRSHDLSVEKEEMEKRQVETDLESFKSEMNPGLLMECLENLLILMQRDVPESDRYVQALANQYRYLLDSRKKDFVSLEEEIKAAGELVYLMNGAAAGRIILEPAQAGEDQSLIPGTLHGILNAIRNIMILNSSDPLSVSICRDENRNLCLRHPNRARLMPGPGIRMDRLEKSYLHYTGSGITRSEDDTRVVWKIPRLPQILKE